MKVAAHGYWALIAILAMVAFRVDATSPVINATDMPAAATLLAHADKIRGSDNAQFVRILRQLHRHEERMTPAQRWHLKFLDAFHAGFEGDYSKARPVLHDIIDHCDNPNLVARATALLINDDSLRRHYEEAYVLANRLMSDLPTLTDPVARRVALSQVISMMNSVGQYDLALKYARQMKASFRSPNGQCEGSLAETQTLQYATRIASTSPAFQKTIDLCLAAKQVVRANSLRLSWASQLNDENHPRRVIAMLQRIAPSVRKAKYQFHIASLHAIQADAYALLGDGAKAHKAALAALAANGANQVNWIVQDANKILYQVEKRAGHNAIALAYYEKYVVQSEATEADNKTRALAYQMVKQEVLAKKLKLDALSKQNKILQLRQTLANKATETSRLYIIVLLLLLAIIVLWLYRIKHSQLRFRRMARTDGLTGAFNRQHFLDEARRMLGRLHKDHTGVCLVLLDLDHFKQVNDTHGHAAGDVVLSHAVATCQRELRASDMCGRLGGEEFGMLMPACSCAQGEEITTRIRRALAATPIQLDTGAEVHVSASFGLACSAISGYELHQLLSVADAALYRAKRGGRNRLAVGTADDAAVTAAQSGGDSAHA